MKPSPPSFFSLLAYTKLSPILVERVLIKRIHVLLDKNIYKINTEQTG